MGALHVKMIARIDVIIDEHTVDIKFSSYAIYIVKSVAIKFRSWS